MFRCSRSRRPATSVGGRSSERRKISGGHAGWGAEPPGRRRSSSGNPAWRRSVRRPVRPAAMAIPTGGRRPGLRGASWRRGGWRRGRRCRRPRRRPTGRGGRRRRRGRSPPRRRGSGRRGRPAASPGWGRGRRRGRRPRWWGSGREASMPVASSQRWSRPRSTSRRAIARDTTSRGARSARGCSAGHEGDALLVPQHGALAPQRLRQQRPGHGRVVEGRGVELHELDVGHGRAGRQGHRHPVAGGQRRVGGDGEQLAGAAAGQHDVAGPHDDGRGYRRRGRPGPRTPATRPPST